MQVARSSFYDRATPDRSDDTALVARMQEIQDEFPTYGYRRITAQLRAGGVLVNRWRVARLMRLHGLQVRPRRRYVATTHSDHGGPIFPNLAKDLTVDGPDRALGERHHLHRDRPSRAGYTTRSTNKRWHPKAVTERTDHHGGSSANRAEWGK